jgi:putative lipoprotein
MLHGCRTRDVVQVQEVAMRFDFKLLALAFAAGCAGPRPTGEAVPEMNPSLPTIEGTATYREKIALPPNAVFEAVVQDVSRADAPAIEIARTTVRKPPQVPIPFRITVNPGDIDTKRNYSVRGRILVDGKLWFVSDMVYPVLMDGASSKVDMLLKRVPSSEPGGGGKPAGASLSNMYWRITQLAGNPVAPPEASRREPQLILREVDGKRTWSATVGCNAMSGSYAVNGDAITFESGISTLMACSSPLDTMELQLRTAISGTRRWRISGNTLELRDETGVTLALFEATPLK